MRVVPTPWEEVSPWAVVIDPAGVPWTVLPSYPLQPRKLRRNSDQHTITLPPQPLGAVVDVVRLDEHEVRQLLHAELGAEEVCPGFGSAQEFQRHITSHHNVPYVAPQRWLHRTPADALRWHRELHTGQTGAPYALMSIPHTHEGL